MIKISWEFWWIRLVYNSNSKYVTKPFHSGQFLRLTRYKKIFIINLNTMIIFNVNQIHSLQDVHIKTVYRIFAYWLNNNSTLCAHVVPLFHHWPYKCITLYFTLYIFFNHMHEKFNILPMNNLFAVISCGRECIWWQ